MLDTLSTRLRVQQVMEISMDRSLLTGFPESRSCIRSTVSVQQYRSSPIPNTVLISEHNQQQDAI